MTALPPADLRCVACARGDDDADPLVEAWVGQDGFWICRPCVADWLAAVWPEVHVPGRPAA